MTLVNQERSYATLAVEYYDPQRHPTCANFRWASERLLERLVPDPPGAWLCEAGAGDSALAAVLAGRDAPLRDVLITDDSAEMLEHSRRWEGRGARLAVAPATALPVGDGSVDLLVASLADPYDDEAWWREAARVLAPEGRVVLTTPAATWAGAFRASAKEPAASARFVLADGTVVDVPSLVRSPAEERALIATAGLRVVAEHAISRAEILLPVSPKLDALAPGDPVVMGYVARRG